MAGLLDFNPENPADISLLSMDSVPVAPGLVGAVPPGEQPPSGAEPPPVMRPGADAADQGPGFWTRLGQGFTDATSGIGLALGGGLDRSIGGEDRSLAGQRALLSFSLNMLANSGPSYTPRNFGQIVASSLAAAGETNQLAEVNKYRRDQANATIGLKMEQQRWNSLMKGLVLQKYLDQQKQGEGVNRLIDQTLGAGAQQPAGLGSVATTTGPVTPEAQADFVNKGWPLWQEIGDKTGLPPEFVAGLSAHETAWGTSPAAQKGNLFGISKDEKPLSYGSPQEGAAAFIGLANSDRYKFDRTGAPSDIAKRFADAGYNTIDKGWAGSVAARAAQVAQIHGGGQPVQIASNAPSVPALTTPPAAAAPAPGLTTTTPAAAPATAPGGTMAAPGAAEGATTPTPPGPAAAPADAPILPKLELGDLDAARAAAKKTRDLELTAARVGTDPAAKAAAFSAAQQKYQAELASIDKEQRDRTSANAIEVAKIQEADRVRQAERANKLADEKTKLEQSITLENLKATNKANEDYGSARLKVDTDRLQKMGDSAAQATRIVRDTRALQQIATGMGPADALGETDIGRQLRNWMVSMNLGSETTLSNLKNQQAWDRTISGLFSDTHTPGIGSQSDREGQWLMQAWGGAGQTPIDRLTQLAIVRKLADERVKDNRDAQDLFTNPDVKSLKGLEDRIGARKSLFDRPPENVAPTDAEKQARYNASHAPGEPYYSWVEVGKGTGNWQQYWTRNTLDKNKRVEYLTPDNTGVQ